MRSFSIQFVENQWRVIVKTDKTAPSDSINQFVEEVYFFDTAQEMCTFIDEYESH